MMSLRILNPGPVAFATGLLLLSGCSSTSSSRTNGDLSRAAAVLQSTPGEETVAVREARRSYREALARNLPNPVEQAHLGDFALPTMPEPMFRNGRQFSQIRLIRSSRSTVSGLIRDGVGLPAYGVVEADREQFTPAKGQLVPITVVATPVKDAKSSDARFALRFANPFELEEIDFGGTTMPLAMNLEEVIRSTKALGPGPLFGFIAGIKSNRFGDSRLSFLQPYDPDKIPLVLIHGLFSTPRMWVPVVKALWANEELRKKYQVWMFFYPNGQPIPASALELREALDSAVAKFNPKPMILVGHSMGGILARSQVSEVSVDRARTILQGVDELPKESLVRQSLIFQPSPYISRVVFIATPHRGSEIALYSFSQLGMSLIRLPDRIRNELLEISEFGIQDSRGRLPTSIHGLSPHSRFLNALSATEPVVPSHSIIGIRGARSPEGSSDGVVRYESSHLPFAVSEATVPSGHGAQANPEAIRELKRILLEAE